LTKIGNAAIGRLAVELAEKDGFAYQLDYGPPHGPRATGRPLTLLDDEGRQRYRGLARRQLEREAGNA
jgi:hypothetical protein